MGTLSQDHRKAIARLKKPDGMRQQTWKDIKALLRMLVRYLPDAHPGQRTLAKRLKTSQSALQRLVVKAEELGYITRSDHVYAGKPRAGTSYQLTLLPTQLVTHLPTLSGSEEDLRSSTTSKTLRVVWFAPEAPNQIHRRRHPSAHRPRPNRYRGYCVVCSFPLQPWDGFLRGHHPVHRQCQAGQPDWPRLKEYLVNKFPEQDPRNWGFDPSVDPEAPLPTYSPPPAKPQARLAKHFEARWNDALGKRRDWRGTYRGIDLGPAIGYINSKMLSAGYNEEHITAMIDEFFLDLLDPEGGLMMKDRQTAWQLFTGWWGRNPVPDPVPIRRRRERLDALNEAVADMIKETTPAPQPIRRRVLTRP